MKITSCVERSRGKRPDGSEWVKYDVGIEGRKWPVSCFTNLTAKIGQEVEGNLVEKPYVNKKGENKTSFTLELPKRGGNSDLARRVADLENWARGIDAKVNGTTQVSPSTTKSPEPDDDRPF